MRRRFRALLVGLGLFGVLLAPGGSSAQAAPKREVFRAPGGPGTAPYSPAVKVGNLIFLSGTIGTSPETRGLVPGGIQAETRQALQNLKANLELAGGSMADVAKCTVYLADINDYQPMNQVYREFFPQDPPARAAFAVAALPAGAKVEIECIAAAR